MSNDNNEEVNDLAGVLEAVDINNNDNNQVIVHQANNEVDDNNESETHESYVFNVLHILAMMTEDEQAAATMTAIATMRRGITQLKKYTPNEGLLRIDIAAFSLHPHLLLQPNDMMLPYWKRFCTALSSISSSGCIKLVLSAVQLDVEVMDLLLESFKKSPLKKLALEQNGLGAQGLRFAVKAINLNTSLERLDIRNNIIESKDDAAFLVDEVINHSKINTLNLDKCGLGESDTVLKSIIPALGSLVAVSLDKNGIGRVGVELIAECLASNPVLRSLSLKGNLLTDQDAQVLANALKTNENLHCLYLEDNSFTNVGISCLFELVYNAINLNSIHESNHSCLLVDTENELSGFNILMDPKRNRHAKLMMALSSRFNMLYLDDTPIEIMPRVVSFVQGRGQLKEGSNLGLNTVYGIISQWSMPLLYTGLSCKKLAVNQT